MGLAAPAQYFSLWLVVLSQDKLKPVTCLAEANTEGCLMWCEQTGHRGRTVKKKHLI